MPKRVKSDETASRTMSIMPTAAFIRLHRGTEPFQMRRFAQDCDPKTYLCTSSGSKDAQIAHIKRRVPLGEKTPHVDKAGTQARRKGKHKELSTAVAWAT